MDLIAVFIIFIACMAASLILGLSMLLPLAVGFCLFFLLAVKRGHTPRAVLGYVIGSFKDSLIVIEVMILIGCLTGMWRLSGTVAYFVTLGVSLIPPAMFLLAAFLLTAIMSYAVGTSFGVTATAGVILMSIARAGSVNTVLAAGAILSGVYVGDRGSPAASSANLVAVLTHTDMRRNVREMLKTSAAPFAVCCVVYCLMSFAAPMQVLDTGILDMLSGEFCLQWYCLIPAVLMIVLPFCNVKVKGAMAVSLAASFVISLTVQHDSLIDCLRAMVMGYSAENAALSDMVSGGGIVSMLEVSAILAISGTYGGIFRGTDMLAALNERLRSASLRIGRFPVMLLLSAGLSALFCNQTISVIMQSQLSDKLYGETEDERNSKMIDIENSGIVVAGLVPWCIACSVPLAMLGADVRSVPFGFFLWLVPLWWLVRTGMKNKTARARGEK